MVQIPLRRAHRLRAIILASPTKKLRPHSTERTPTAWHTNDEASEEANASSAVANVSENKILPITHVLLLTSDTNPALISVSTQWGPSMTDWGPAGCFISSCSLACAWLATFGLANVTIEQTAPAPSLGG